MRSRGAAIALAVYLVVLALLTLWPTHPDAVIQPFTTTLLADLARSRATSWISYPVLNDLANAVLFVIAGILAILAFGRRGWWWSIVVGCAVAGLFEVAQALFLPGRTPDVSDVVSGAVGTLVGVGIGLAIVMARRSETPNAAARTTSPDDGA